MNKKSCEFNDDLIQRVPSFYRGIVRCFNARAARYAEAVPAAKVDSEIRKKWRRANAAFNARVFSNTAGPIAVMAACALSHGALLPFFIAAGAWGGAEIGGTVYGIKNSMEGNALRTNHPVAAPKPPARG